MVSEAIDFRFLLIENYKRMGISEIELATIFVIDHLIDQGNPIITADILSLKMALPIKDIDNCLASLLKKNIIDYITQNKKTITTLNPLKKRLFKEFQLTISDERKNGKKMEEEFQNIFTVYQNELGRILSPVEISKIREWVSYGYSDEIIINALKEALSKGKRSLRSVDKILLSWATRDDIQSEGRSVRDESWQKSIEETIKIAETPWIKDDKD